jgi:hypothetical protein
VSQQVKVLQGRVEDAGKIAALAQARFESATKMVGKAQAALVEEFQVSTVVDAKALLQSLEKDLLARMDSVESALAEVER